MKAARVFHQKYLMRDGAIVEMTIWRVPKRVRGSAHELKYRLFYGYPGTRVIGYDNETGKGDHRHVRNVESVYRFVNVEQLVSDFLRDVKRERGSMIATNDRGARRTKATLHYGESLDDLGARFIGAWRRAESGRRVQETHLSFEDLAGLVSVLTPRRMDLLRAVHGSPARDIRALSRTLDRDYKNVHADVTALVGAGLLVRDDQGLHAPYDVISAEMRL